MSNLPAGVRDRPDAAYQPPVLAAPAAHVRLADRVSLRLGLWLLVRSVAHVEHQADRAAHALRLENERAREARELAYQRERLLQPSL